MEKKKKKEKDMKKIRKLQVRLKLSKNIQIEPEKYLLFFDKGEVRQGGRGGWGRKSELTETGSIALSAVPNSKSCIKVRLDGMFIVE